MSGSVGSDVSTAVPCTKDQTGPLYPAVIAFGVASATLLLQTVQTRIYAVIFWNHLVYFIVSVALLGFGISGTWLAFGESSRIARFLTLGRAAVGFVVTALISSLFVPRLGVAYSALFSSGPHLLRMMITYSTAAFPYFFAGWILGMVYRDHARHIHFLYFADLVGAATGCLLLLVLIRPLGPIFLVLLSCVLVAFPVLLRRGQRNGKVAAAAILVGLLALGAWNGDIERGIVPDRSKASHDLYKDLAPNDQRIIEYSEWNSICRTDVIGTKLSPQKRIFIDGDAYTGMEHKGVGEPRPFDLEKEALVPHKTPYVLERPRDNVLVIGPGGGHDVWDALRGGARQIDAVEINPSTVHLVTREYREEVHGLFERSGVTLWNEEGRSFVRQQNRRYDIIMINAIDTFAALDAGAYMLAENYLYTVDGILDYINHLTPEGTLCITRWDYAGETTRLFTVMLEALYEAGYAEPEHHIAAQTRASWTAILASPAPFTEQEIAALRSHTEKHSGIFCFPLRAEECTKPLQRDLNAYAEARAQGSQKQFFDAYYYNVRPVRDDSPFFFHYEKVRNLFQVFHEHSPGDYVRGHWPSFTLSVLLLLLSVALAVFVFLPLRRRGRGDLPNFGLWLLYFCCLGVSFIFVEISLMQRFALLLGHPARSLALVLAALLFFAGLGSYAKERFRAPLGLALAVLCGVLLAVAFAYPHVVNLLLGFPLWVRGIATLALVAPAALFMGMPFPTGIRLVSDRSRDAVPWMWGVNGGATVFGSILAIACAIRIGFTGVLCLASCGYAIALAAYLYISSRQVDSSQ